MIPQSFECLGLVVTVKRTKLKKSYGKWKPNKLEILIDTRSAEQVQEQAFWHEAVHCILDSLGYDKLSGNEKLVDRLGHCLYQLDRSRK
jgi:hypothetical protein